MIEQDPMRAQAEKDAQRFHEAYERLAPQFGYKTRDASAVPWQEVPEANRKLMVAVCREVGGKIRSIVCSLQLDYAGRLDDHDLWRRSTRDRPLL